MLAAIFFRQVFFAKKYHKIEKLQLSASKSNNNAMGINKKRIKKFNMLYMSYHVLPMVLYNIGTKYWNAHMVNHPPFIGDDVASTTM